MAKKEFLVFVLAIAFFAIATGTAFTQQYDSAGDLIYNEFGVEKAVTSAGDTLYEAAEKSSRFGAGVGNVVGDVMSGKSPSTSSFMEGWNDNTNKTTNTITNSRDSYEQDKAYIREDTKSRIDRGINEVENGN
jgi:hypothetical protein